MTVHPLQTFRLQFIGSPTERSETVVAERTIRAADVEGAANAAGKADWPFSARSYRLFDLDGRELAHVFKLDP
jgi:hypothetical protein